MTNDSIALRLSHFLPFPHSFIQQLCFSPPWSFCFVFLRRRSRSISDSSEERTMNGASPAHPSSVSVATTIGGGGGGGQGGGGTTSGAAAAAAAATGTLSSDDNSSFHFPTDLISAQDRKDEALHVLKTDLMAALRKEVKSLDEDNWMFAGPRSQIQHISRPGGFLHKQDEPARRWN